MTNDWQLHQVTLTRTSGCGLGMAVAGGVDSPYVPGETAIIISDVLRDGPAEGKLCVGDRLLSVNGVSLLDVSHGFAIQQLNLAGGHVDLVVHRRVKAPARPAHSLTNGFGLVPATAPASPRMNGGSAEVVLARRGAWEELGMNLGYRLFISGVSDGSLAQREGLRAGDVVRAVNGIAADHLSLQDAVALIGRREEVRLTVERAPEGLLPKPRDTTDAVPRTVANLKAASNHNNNVRATNRTPGLEGPRRIALRRDPSRSTGLRITGGNATGVFVASVEPGSPAEQVGLREGDKLLSIGKLETAGLTKEEAALELIGQDSALDLVVTAANAELSRFVASGEAGDSLYIRAHFDFRGGSCGGSGSPEAAFRRGQIFHVVDTMFAGVVGSWRAVRVLPPPGPAESKEVVIPNENRAAQLALTGGRPVPPGRQPSSFLRRKRSKSANPGPRSSEPSSSGSSSSLAPWEKAFFGSEGPAPDPFPPYERVVLRHPGFPRPVVLFGPLASDARDRLLRERPDFFRGVEPPKEASPGRSVIKLSLIRAVMSSGRHAVLDVTPGAVRRLNFAQLAPIVLYLRPESKPVMKAIRAQFARYSGRSGKRLLEEATSLEAVAGHLFTGVVPLRLQHGANALTDWFAFLLEMVQHQQREPTWMPVEAPASKDDVISVRQGDVSRMSAPNLLDADLGAAEGTLTRSVSDPHLISPPKPPRLQNGGTDLGYVSDGRQQPISVGRARGRGISRWGADGGLGLGGLSQSSCTLLGRENGAAHDDDVDPYAVHTLPGKRSLLNSSAPPAQPGLNGDGYATVRKPAAAPAVHDTYRYVRSSAMAPAGHGAKVPPRPPPPNARQSAFNPQLRAQPPMERSAANLRPSSSRLELPTGSRSPVSSEGPFLGDRPVLAEVSAVFDDRGGCLESREHQVSLRIPPGALPSGSKQEVYFKIYKESGVSLPSMDTESRVSGHSSGGGATLVSPLVMCGPHGLRFLRPVELRMPHRPDLRPDSWQFSLLHASSNSDQPGRWRETRVGGPPEVTRGPARLLGATPRVLDNGQISVLVDHF